MKWLKPTQKDKSVEIPESWIFLPYYEALTVLFRIENALRVFTYVILKNEFYEKWSEVNVITDAGENKSMETIAKQRIAQAGEYGYLGYLIKCPIMHLTTGEIIKVITSPAYWKFFAKYLPGSKNIIETKLYEMAQVRNSLSHFRPIKEGDIELIKQNAKHVLETVELVITEMITSVNVVPTNTGDNWYVALKDLSSENCKLSFQQSKDEDWIRIRLSYNCPVLKCDNIYDNYCAIRALNVMTPNILKIYDVLTKYITYLSESNPAGRMHDGLKPSFSKSLYFVFNKKTLSTYHVEIKEDFQKILRQITDETTLIKEDNLAKGKIIEAISTSASLEGAEDKKRWSFRTGNFAYAVQGDDPAEYWGDIYLFNSDFVSAIHRYPWMPVAISDISWSF